MSLGMYQYTALNYPSQQLRLLELIPDHRRFVVCRLQAFNLKDAPPYSALSYVWCNASITKYIGILLEGDDWKGSNDSCYELEVSINLASALRRLRDRQQFDWSTKRLWIWADAVCIDQSCVIERNEQVRIMHHIYASAEMVWVYPVDVSTEGEHFRVSPEAVGRRLEFYAKAYWTRSWVVQELFFAREVTILYRDMEASFDYKSWKPGRTPLVRGLGFYGDPPSHIQHELLHMKRTKYLDFANSSNGPHTLYNFLWQCRRRRSFLPQDKIYSLMNIVPRSTSIVQDYSKPPANVYGAFMKEVVALGSASVPCKPLDFLKPTHNISTPHLEGLPTWSPDFCEHADTVDILDGVSRNRFTMYERADQYQPWLHLHKKANSDGQITEPHKGSATSITIPRWDLPLAPLSCIAAVLDTTEPATELTIRGVRLDILQELGENIQPDDPTFRVEDILHVWRALIWKPLASGAYRTTDESAQSAFFKVLIANARQAESAHDHIAVHLEHAVFGETKPLKTKATSAFLKDLGLCLLGWRFAVTSEGYFAKVPNMAESGDVICVPLGSSTPFVLRPQGSKYELVGRCFVHGFMKGEAMEKLNVACQEVLGRKSKKELSKQDWARLKEIVNEELEPFTLI